MPLCILPSGIGKKKSGTNVLNSHKTLDLFPPLIFLIIHKARVDYRSD